MTHMLRVELSTNQVGVILSLIRDEQLGINPCQRNSKVNILRNHLGYETWIGVINSAVDVFKLVHQDMLKEEAKEAEAWKMRHSSIDRSRGSNAR